MKDLIEVYENRLKELLLSRRAGNKSERLAIKLGCYRGFINDLKNTIKDLKETKNSITFVQYIKMERTEYFYETTISDMIGCNTKQTIEEWLSDMYTDYKLLYCV